MCRSQLTRPSQAAIMMTQQSEPLIQPTSENSILEGRMENSSTTCEVQTEGENSQMEMPTDVTCGENSRKEQMQ